MAKNDLIVPITECSRITQGTELIGNIVANSDYRVDGKFTGNLSTSGKVILGETSVFLGDICSSGIDIWGKLDGNLLTDGLSTFHNTAIFSGKLETKKFVVELGAEFNGTCTFIKDQQN